MNRFIKISLIFLFFLLLVPYSVLAKQDDRSISDFVILEDKKINQDSCENITIVFGSADIQTDVDGSIIVAFGNATINGNVNGDVVSIFGEVSLQKDSRVQGNLVSVGKLDKSQGVSILGTNLSINFDLISLFESNGILINTLIIFSLVTLIAGLILISIFATRYRNMAYSIKNGVSRRLALGVLVIISCTIVLAFLIFFIIAPILYVLLIMFADIIASIYLGTIIFKNNSEKSTIFLEFFVGHIIISIFKIVPLILLPSGSYLALMIYGICLIVLELLMASFGIGTVIDTGFGKNTKQVSYNKP